MGVRSGQKADFVRQALLCNSASVSPRRRMIGKWRRKRGAAGDLRSPHRFISRAEVYALPRCPKARHLGNPASVVVLTSPRTWATRLFGGSGYDSVSTNGSLNDLWEFNLIAKTWTWVGGAKMAGATGVYGTLGVTSTGTAPGARNSAISWTDSSGNFWLFGGWDSTGTNVLLNDLWRYQ